MLRDKRRRRNSGSLLNPVGAEQVPADKNNRPSPLLVDLANDSDSEEVAEEEEYKLPIDVAKNPFLCKYDDTYGLRDEDDCEIVCEIFKEGHPDINSTPTETVTAPKTAIRLNKQNRGSQNDEGSDTDFEEEFSDAENVPRWRNLSSTIPNSTVTAVPPGTNSREQCPLCKKTYPSSAYLQAHLNNEDWGCSKNVKNLFDVDLYKCLKCSGNNFESSSQYTKLYSLIQHVAKCSGTAHLPLPAKKKCPHINEELISGVHNEINDFSEKTRDLIDKVGIPTQSEDFSNKTMPQKRLPTPQLRIRHRRVAPPPPIIQIHVQETQNNHVTPEPLEASFGQNQPIEETIPKSRMSATTPEPLVISGNENIVKKTIPKSRMSATTPEPLVISGNENIVKKTIPESRKFTATPEPSVISGNENIVEKTIPESRKFTATPEPSVISGSENIVEKTIPESRKFTATPEPSVISGSENIVEKTIPESRKFTITPEHLVISGNKNIEKTIPESRNFAATPEPSVIFISGHEIYPDPTETDDTKTRVGIPFYSQYERISGIPEPSEVSFRLKTFPEENIPSKIELEFKVQKCIRCGGEPKPTLKEGLQHLKKRHNMERCPRCFARVFIPEFETHMQKHFIMNEGGLPRLVDCVYCGKHVNYKKLWEHLIESHLQNNSPVCSTGQVGHNSSRALRLPAKELSSNEEPNHTFRTPAPPKKTAIPRPPASTAGSVAETFISIGASCGCNGCKPNSRCKTDGSHISKPRHNFSVKKTEYLKKAFLENPNKPWDERVERLKKRFGCQHEKIKSWFMNTRSAMIRGHCPSWARDESKTKLYEWKEVNEELIISRITSGKDGCNKTAKEDQNTTSSYAGCTRSTTRRRSSVNIRNQDASILEIRVESDSPQLKISIPLQTLREAERGKSKGRTEKLRSRNESPNTVNVSQPSEQNSGRNKIEHSGHSHRSQNKKYKCSASQTTEDEMQQENTNISTKPSQEGSSHKEKHKKIRTNGKICETFEKDGQQAGNNKQQNKRRHPSSVTARESEKKRSSPGESKIRSSDDKISFDESKKNTIETRKLKKKLLFQNS